jgi:uncharacterized protein (DUF1778 family)
MPYNTDLGVHPMQYHANRSARLEARISEEALEMVKRAAAIEGRSLSDFVVAAAHTAARRTIEATQVVHLSLEDQRAFVDALLSPPPLASALERGRKAHAELIDTSE